MNIDTKTEVEKTCEYNAFHELIYELIFGKKNIILIKFDDFCEYNERLDFKEKIRTILASADVKIKDDRIIHTADYLLWKLETQKI